MSGWQVALAVAVALPLLLWVAGQLGALRGSEPADLGVVDGRLKRPSRTPNSVHSQADLWADHPQHGSARIAPLALKGDGPATLALLAKIVTAMPGGSVVRTLPGYVYAQFSTPQLKFTDDVEFWFDEARQVVHVRSGSRIGRKDFNVNRERVEAIRARLLAA